MKINLALGLAVSLLLMMEPVSAAPDVQVFEDREAGGWADKAADFAFVAEIPGCRIQWNAAESKDGRRGLSMRPSCKAGFTEQISLHRAILTAINAKWPLPSFTGMAFGPLCENGDFSLCQSIVESSLKSKDYLDYARHYPHSKLKSINGLFVELANNTRAYAGLADLLAEFGVAIRLTSVEKVFESRLDNPSLALVFKPLAAGRKPKARAMYDAGSWYFSLSPAKPAPTPAHPGNDG